MSTIQPSGTVVCDPLSTGQQCLGEVVETVPRRDTSLPWLVVRIGESRYRVAPEDTR